MDAGVENDEAVAEEVRGWLKDNWDPTITVREWWARLADSGWGFPTWPEEWFGRGLSSDAAVVVRRELSEANVLGPPIGMGVSLTSGVLFTHGTEEQKARWLPAIARGEEAWCQFFSEPGAGSDLASAQTRAVRDGDEWIVNGQKVWSSGAREADHGILVARTDIDVPKHKGLSFFGIDVEQPGIELRPIKQMNGQSHFNESFFTDARVPDENLIGGLSNGWAVAMTTLAHERTTYAAGRDYSLRGVAPGVKEGNLDRIVGDVMSEPPGDSGWTAAFPLGFSDALVAVAKQYGADRDRTMRQRIAGLYALSEAIRFTGLRVKAAVQAGRPPGVESSIAYLAGVTIARQTRDLGLAMLGPHGMVMGPGAPLDGAVAMMALTVPCHGIMGGSEQIQRNIIGERVLGLPKEPQVDRDVPFRQIEGRDPARLARAGSAGAIIEPSSLRGVVRVGSREVDHPVARRPRAAAAGRGREAGAFLAGPVAGGRPRRPARRLRVDLLRHADRRVGDAAAQRRRHPPHVVDGAQPQHRREA